MNKKKQHENEVLENDLVSWFEEKLGHLKPYWSQIVLGICAVAAVAVAGTYFLQQSKSAEAAKWQNLSNAQLNYRSSLDNTSLSDFAGQYPDDPAGMWARLFAADAEMRSGLADFSTDRKSGFDKIKKAQEFYKQIVDSTTKKSTMLQRRSLYGLAYAYESNGEFDLATELYQKLVDFGDKTPFADHAKRGLERTTNPQFALLFNQFRDYVDAPEEAPGMRLPQRPDISFPEVGIQPDSGGGDFSAGAEDSDG